MLARSVRRAPPAWSVVLAGGGALWLGTVAITALTHNSLLLPTDVMLGSFVVPVALTLLLFERASSRALAPRRLAVAFALGGATAMVTAAFLEQWLLPDGTLLRYLAIALIEEMSKGLVLVALAVGLRRESVRTGVLLGAAIGLGYSAFESSGYALSTLSAAGGPDLTNGLAAMIRNEAVRAAMAPLMHGLWTGVLGGALFATSRTGRVRGALLVAGGLLFVVGLHGAWDAMSVVAARAALAANPPSLILRLLTLDGLKVGGTIAVSAAGLTALRAAWRTPAR